MEAAGVTELNNLIAETYHQAKKGGWGTALSTWKQIPLLPGGAVVIEAIVRLDIPVPEDSSYLAGYLSE